MLRVLRTPKAYFRPHQLRGFLAQFRTLPIIGAAYSRCTGCSDTVRLRRGWARGTNAAQVVRAYEKDGFAMMLRAFNENKFLEELTGLDQLYREGEAALENVDWAEEAGDDEDDF